MFEEIKTFEDRKKELIELGKKNGQITYEQLAEKLKNLDREKLVKFSNEKKFDWTLFEEIIS